MIMCSMRGRMVIMVRMLHSREIQHQVPGHHVSFELRLVGARTPFPPTLQSLLGRQKGFATIAGLDAGPVARRVASGVA